MKIVLVDKEEGLKIGGVVVFTNRLYQYLTSLGHQVAIMRFARNQIKQKDVYYIPYYIAESRSYIFVPSEKTLSMIKKYLSKVKPDIVYMSVGISPFDFFIPSLCHELNIPIAGIWHGDINDNNAYLNVLIKSIFLAYLPFCKQLDLLHVFSLKLKKFYFSKGIPEERILVLPNGVDHAFYSPGRSHFGVQNGFKKGIVFVGRLTLVKNPELLIRSFLSLNPSFNTKLVLVGHGELEEELRDQYKDNRVIFTGLISDEKQKLEILRACHLFVLPSRYEGMSLALLEAMSTGLACIASNVGTNGELLGNSGIVLQENKLKNELPLSIRICLDHPDFGRKLGRMARKKILKYHSQNMIFHHLTQALKTTVKNYKHREISILKPLNVDAFVLKKIETIWQKVKKVGIDFNLN